MIIQIWDFNFVVVNSWILIVLWRKKEKDHPVFLIDEIINKNWQSWLILRVAVYTRVHWLRSWKFRKHSVNRCNKLNLWNFGLQSTQLPWGSVRLTDKLYTKDEGCAHHRNIVSSLLDLLIRIVWCRQSCKNGKPATVKRSRWGMKCWKLPRPISRRYRSPAQKGFSGIWLNPLIRFGCLTLVKTLPDSMEILIGPQRPSYPNCGGHRKGRSSRRAVIHETRRSLGTRWKETPRGSGTVVKQSDHNLAASYIILLPRCFRITSRAMRTYLTA